MGLNENKVTHASDPIADAAAHPESSVSGASSALQETLDPTLEAFGLRKPPPDEDESQPKDRNALLHNISSGVNALTMLQSMPSQLLNTGLAEVPLLDKMPGMPAAVIGAAHLGTPHAHDHPPSDGIPLPSVGSTIGSGCLSVLIGGIPSARVLDIGIAPTCGGLTPLFDITTGSSNTFIGGMRAARMGIDQTRHCNPMAHVGKEEGEAGQAAEEGEHVASEAEQVTGRARVLGGAGKAWKYGNAALGPASGVASSVDEATSGEGATAAMTAAQTAADAAMMALSNLMGKDPGIEPSMGMLMDGNPTVLIGGFPMPDSQMMWHGVKHGIGKKVRPKLPKLGQELACEFFGEPVNAVTGEVKNDFTDYETDAVVPFKWSRHYCSGWHERDGVLGYGFRHAWQHELQLLRTRAIYTDPRGTEYAFGKRADGTYGGCCQGYEIKQLDGQRFIVQHEVEGELEFKRFSEMDRSARCVGHVRNGACNVLHWDQDGRLGRITQADEGGHVRRAIGFGYDRSRIIEVALTDIDGQINRIAWYAYDTDGCLDTHRNALEAMASYAYDEQRRITRLTDANGYSFFYRYDASGRCVESKGQDGLWHVQFQYHPGRTIVTEGDGGKWTVLYNDAGTITRVIDPYGGAMEYVLGADGRIESEIDVGGRVTRWLYDIRGRNTGRLDQWGYRWPVKDEAPVLPNRPLRTVPGTPLRLQWGKIDKSEQADRTLVPPQIERIADTIFVPRALPWTSAIERHDAAGRIIERTDEGGHTERFRRDAAGNAIGRHDGDRRDYRYDIASWNLRVAETDPLGNTVRYRHTSKQQIEAIVDANGNESAYAYDQLGRITRVMRHGVVRETYAYDAANLLTEKRDGAGNLLLRFEAGTNGLYRRRILASGEIHVYDYDARGNTIRASTDKHDVTLTYDASNRRSADKRDSRGVEHVRSRGCLAGTTYFGRFTVRYETVGDHEVRIHTPEGGCHQVHRGAEGRVLLNAANGTSILSGFDAAERCIGQIVWKRHHQDQPRYVRYEYSATGELRRVTSGAGDSKEYQYDAAHRLAGESRDGWPVRRFEYDRAGNLLSTPVVAWMRYAEGNRLATSSLGTFRYNDRNHLAEFARADGVRTFFHYNSKDLLVEVSWSDRPEVWTAGYDGLCRRTHQAYGGQTTHYYWDGDRLAAELGPDGRFRLYIYANESSLSPFLFIDYPSCDAAPAEGRAYLVCSDQVGLPQWIEDSEGAVVWMAADVDPYGGIRVAEGNLVDYNLRFPGHYFDAATGLHYNRFRSYSPELGRYLQSDPIGQSGGINLYAYVTNPLVRVDVLGLHDASDGREPKPDEETEAAERRAKAVAHETFDKMMEAANEGEPRITVDDGREGTTLKTGKSTMGTCLTVVVFKPTLDIFLAQNQREIISADMFPASGHRAIQELLRRHELVRDHCTTRSGGPCASHTRWYSVPGKHGDVIGVGRAFNARILEGDDPDFGDITMYNVRLQDSNPGGNGILPAGTPMHRCVHCGPITDGVDVPSDSNELITTYRERMRHFKRLG